MTLQQLEYFKVLAEIKHYTNASKILHISQPSLSYAISALEDELGIKLFEKTGRKIELSSAGQVFYDNVVDVLRLVEKTVAETKRAAGLGEISIRLGYIYSAGAYYVPELIRGYLEQKNRDYPFFDLVQDSNDALVAGLEKGDLDLAFLGKPTNGIGKAPAFEQQLYLVVPETHPLATKSTVTLSDLEGESLVLTKKESGLRKDLDRVFFEAGFKPNVSIEVTECNAILAYVSLGHGLGIVPDVPAVDMEGIVKRHIDNPGFIRTIYLCWSGSKMNKSVKAFKDYVIKE